MGERRLVALLWRVINVLWDFLERLPRHRGELYLHCYISSFPSFVVFRWR